MPAGDACSALAKLYTPDGSRPRYPLCFLTNGGGVTERVKAHQLSEWLGVAVDESQVGFNRAQPPGWPSCTASVVACLSRPRGRLHQHDAACVTPASCGLQGWPAPQPHPHPWRLCAPPQVVLSHTPFRQLVGQYGDQPVLVSGRGQVGTRAGLGWAALQHQ